MGQILPRVLHFIIFTTYLTTRLNENRGDYAVYLELYAYASILIVFFSYRMDTSMFRFGRKEEDLDEVYASAFFPLLMSAFLLVLIGFLFDNTLANWLSYDDKPYYIRWFCWIIALDVMNLLPFARLRLQGKAMLFIKYKVFNIALTILIVFLTLEWLSPELRERYMPFCKGDIDFVFIANLIASAVLFLALMCYHFPRKMTFDVQLWRKMALYGWPLVIVGVAGSFNQFFAVPLQKYLLGGEILLNQDRAAVYGAVQKIPALLALFTTAYNYAAEPFFFKNSEEKDSSRLYGQITLYFIIAAGVISIGLNSLIDIFRFLIGSNFREGLYLVPVLLMAYLFLGIYYNVSIWYKLADKTIYGAVIASVGAGVTLIFSLLLLPVYGVDASAWTALLCYVSMVLLAWWLGRKYYPIHYPLRRISLHLLMITFFLLLGSTVNYYYDNSLWRGVIVLFSYMALLILVEKRALKRIVIGKIGV